MQRLFLLMSGSHHAFSLPLALPNTDYIFVIKRQNPISYIIYRVNSTLVLFPENKKMYFGKKIIV